MNTERLSEYVKSLEKKHNQLLVNIKAKLPELERQQAWLLTISATK